MNRAQTAWAAMRPRLVLQALLLVACTHVADYVLAQSVQLSPIPGELSVEDRRDLESRRASLLQQREAMLAKITRHDAKCSKVPEDSPLVADCSGDQASLSAEIRSYQNAVAEFNHLVSETLARAKEKPGNCEAVARQAEKDREQIERLMRTTEASQEELAEWSKLNEEAQKKAVEAAVMYTLGEFTANIETVRDSVSKLEHHAEYLTKKAAQSRKYQTRIKYLSELDAMSAQMETKWGNLVSKTVVNTGLEIEKAWSTSRDTMHHQFRVASKRNEAMREVLKDPEFKEAFTGDDIDTPGLDVLSALTEQAGEELGKFELGLQRYEKFTGPAIRAAVFVRDAAYSALLSTLSTQRVLQQNDLAGEAAKAARALQLQYQKSVDAQRACRAGGSAKPGV